MKGSRSRRALSAGVLARLIDRRKIGLVSDPSEICTVTSLSTCVILENPATERMRLSSLPTYVRGRTVERSIRVPITATTTH